MFRFIRARRFWAVLVPVLLLAACGGGGGGGTSESSGNSSAPTTLSRVHQPATLTVTGANGHHLLAHSYLTLYALEEYMRQSRVAMNNSRATPKNPISNIVLYRGTQTDTFTDVDKNGQVSVGDTLRIEITFDRVEGSREAYRTSELYTIAQMDGEDVTSVWIQISGWRYIFGVDNSAVELSGAVDLRATETAYVLESQRGLSAVVMSATNSTSTVARLSLENVQAFDLGNQGFGTYMDVSMDVTITSPKTATGRFQLETTDTIRAGTILNAAPWPGKLMVKGAGGTSASLRGFPSVTDFTVDIDPLGSGVPSVTSTTDNKAFYRAL